MAAFEKFGAVFFSLPTVPNILRMHQDIVKHKMENCAFFASSEKLGIGDARILRRVTSPGAKFDHRYLDVEQKMLTFPCADHGLVCIPFRFLHCDNRCCELFTKKFFKRLATLEFGQCLVDMAGQGMCPVIT